MKRKEEIIKMDFFIITVLLRVLNYGNIPLYVAFGKVKEG